jgi:asparaginyl-tRNA synthetase
MITKQKNSMKNGNYASSLETAVTVSPSKSWENLDEHFLNLFEDHWYRHLFRIQSEFSYASLTFFREKGFENTMLPVTTGSISSPFGLGSDSSPVRINLEGIDTYLADSMQFLLELALRMTDREGVAYIMPSFRGEMADERHLCQFNHAEAEIKGTLDDTINLIEDYLRKITTSILESCRTEILEITPNIDHIEALLNQKISFPRIRYSAALELLADEPNAISKLEGTDLDTVSNYGEQLLIKKFNGPVWLTHMPNLLVPFYQAEDCETYSKSADLLMGIGEVVGAGERQENKQDLIKALELRGNKPEEYDWYIKMKTEFPVKTSGFGMGVERYLLWLLNHNDIRDCQILPRFNGEVCNP